jgi:hypothetical protein
MSQAYGWLDEPLAEYLMRFDDAEKRKFREGGELLQLKPAIWPVGENVIDGNDHYSGNVVAKVGDTLMIWLVSRLQHFGGAGDRVNAGSSRAGFARSTDGGETWSPLRRLDHELGQTGQDARIANLGWGGFVTDYGGDAVILCSQGVFRSRDQGVTWEVVSHDLKRFSQNIGTWNHVACHHPEKGLLILGNPGNDRIGLQNSIFIRYSKDLSHWEEESQTLPPNMVPAEPTAVYHEGKLVFATRNGSNGQGWPYAQMLSHTGWLPLTEFGETNITQSGRTGDNTELIFNPLTGRYECIAGNRGGGGPGEEGAPCISVNLWSIAPEELYAGSTQWRFEGTLLKRQGRFGEIDGHYPSGTCIDLEKKVQYICVWMGVPSDKSAVFLIARTLDTPALSAYLRKG